MIFLKGVDSSKSLQANSKPLQSTTFDRGTDYLNRGGNSDRFPGDADVIKGDRETQYFVQVPNSAYDHSQHSINNEHEHCLYLKDYSKTVSPHSNTRTQTITSSSDLSQTNSSLAEQYLDFVSGGSINSANLLNTTPNLNKQCSNKDVKSDIKDYTGCSKPDAQDLYYNSTYTALASDSKYKELLTYSKSYKTEAKETSSSSFIGDYASEWGSYRNNGNQDLNRNSQTTVKMSGGPPHHHHGRQAPSPNSAWNHLQVPNYYARQPQHAHMSNEHPLLHQPTWHTPTTEPVKTVSHSHLFNLEQMISDRPYPRHSPGVDLSLQRNGSQNGELPTTPISLSVRDANKINSLPASAIDIQAVELTKSLSPGLKAASPGLKSSANIMKPASPILKPPTPTSPGIKSPISPGISSSPGLHEKQDSPKNIKRPAKRMDSIIERLNPAAEKNEKEKSLGMNVILEKPQEDKWQSQSFEKSTQEHPEKICQSSVIVQPSTTGSSQDENSNSSSVVNVPTPTNLRDDEVSSPFSNEDSTDSSKSRRKRKPAKTMRVPKDIEKVMEPEIPEDTSVVKELLANEHQKSTTEVQVERRRSGSAPPGSPTPPLRNRRKASSESETIANIAAMVEETAPTSPQANHFVQPVVTRATESHPIAIESKPISVSVIKTKGDVDVNPKESSESVTSGIKIPTPAQKKITDPNSFVEVENKLEEMFAGIDDGGSPKMRAIDYEDSKSLGLEENKHEESFKLDDSVISVASTSQFNDSVTSTSNDQNLQKRGRPKGSKAARDPTEISPKRKKGNKKLKLEGTMKTKASVKKMKGKNYFANKQITTKVDLIKDIYAYDSGSNASSNKSRGPYIQIRGPRDSPISVSIVNTPTNDEDSDKKSNKSRKYHDDVEYRHKVRSRGLHCSTLSNKYDAQTRDATWICAFCKRGPHATDPHTSGPSRFNGTVLIPPPGDLFGPYIITTNCPEYERRLDDPYDQQFRSKKVARVVTATTTNNKALKKAKRKHSETQDRSFIDGTEDIYLGITETKDKVYEVWVHEDCIVWSPGVYLVGPKIIGLEEAVWTSCSVMCSKCRYRGANVCCVKRGCMNVMHFGCAAASDWLLDEENYKALCFAHKTP